MEEEHVFLPLKSEGVHRLIAASLRLTIQEKSRNRTSEYHNAHSLGYEMSKLFLVLLDRPLECNSLPFRKVAPVTANLAGVHCNRLLHNRPGSGVVNHMCFTSHARMRFRVGAVRAGKQYILACWRQLPTPAASW